MEGATVRPEDFTIHKTVLEVEDFQTITCQGKIERWLTARMQNGKLTAWYEVDLSEGGATEAVLRVVGTGHARPVFGGTYIGTDIDGLFVWHVYETGRTWAPSGPTH